MTRFIFPRFSSSPFLAPGPPNSQLPLQILLASPSFSHLYGFASSCTYYPSLIEQIDHQRVLKVRPLRQKSDVQSEAAKVRAGK